MGQFSDPVATHPRTNEVEVPPPPPGACHTGKLVENGKECEEAQMEEEGKVHDDSQTEEVILKPIAEHKGKCPLQTNSTRQGRWSFRKQNLKHRRNPMFFGSRATSPLKFQLLRVSSLLIFLIT